MDKSRTFVEEGVIFTVSEEDDGKFVADIRYQEPSRDLDEDWARVVGRFDSMGDAITAAKGEIKKLVR